MMWIFKGDDNLTYNVYDRLEHKLLASFNDEKAADAFLHRNNKNGCCVMIVTEKDEDYKASRLAD